MMTNGWKKYQHVYGQLRILEPGNDCYRNWPRYGLCWSGLCWHSRHSTSGAGRRAAAPASSTSAVPGVAAQTTSAQTVWVVNFYSTTKTKQCTTINPATIMTMSHHAETPWLTTSLWWWKRIDDVTIAELLTFEIISGVARNERYGFYPSALRAGGVLSSRFGRAAGRAAAKLAEPISL